LSSEITEWEFTADVASWINEQLKVDLSLPFSRAKCEQRGKASNKRRDLTLLDKNDVVVLTGEVKLPFREEGGSPYIESVVQDARQKALKAGTNFFFTWNVNEFVLWETFPAKMAQKDRKYRSWVVTDVNKPSHMEIPSTIYAIKSWLSLFLHDFLRIMQGSVILGMRSPDEKFIDALESSLKVPILHTIDELENRYKVAKFKSQLDRWMREEQGWTIYNDREGIRENIERTAKFTCYALVNKLVFHEALLKRYGAQIQKLGVPKHLDTGEDLRLHLEGFFEEAKNITRDYETVFGEDHTGIGNRIPFYSDKVVSHWRTLIEQIHEFDFSKLDYEVIGSIFEHLISPEERHKYGQFYTKPEVVDLINSFCIANGHEKVMDPACGGGTFLVRAYARKRNISPSRKHGEMLNDLFGIDISHFATHLTTINLATRDLIDEENYPQIARSDFFDVAPNKVFLQLPKQIKTKGMGKAQHREIEIPPLDAIVGNPPYIRQEEIPKERKTYYQGLAKDEMEADLTARSDIHCYFWPHAATFLKDAGFLCFLTSSQWLDVDYGFRLQEWLLKHFEIIAVFESMDEPWFVGARVATAITILRRQKDEEKRMSNIIRFVQLRRPMREILSHDGTTAGAITAANDFRDEILQLGENTANERYRARLVTQETLWDEGIAIGASLGKPNQYIGGKWGVYLRSPDLWGTILDDYGNRFKRLGELVEIRFGVKSGKDTFFYPIDSTPQCLEKIENEWIFEQTYGVKRTLVESGELKLVLCGDGRGELKPIESKYLEPEVHSLMEVDGFTVSPTDCSRMILLVGETREELKGSCVLDYIEWGEEKNFHKGATCAARVTNDREWYDLTGHERGEIFWPKSQQYKHAIPLNEYNLQCNCNLYDIYLHEKIDPQLLAGILNSTIVVLSKHQYGRPVGVEGNLKTEIIDVNMMPVPDPTTASIKVRHRIINAFLKLKKRKALFFLSERRLREMAYRQHGKEKELLKISDTNELDLEDRRELDDAVFELIGITSKKRRRELLDQLYTYLREFFEWTRQKEEKAIANKKSVNRRLHIRPNEIAAQIFQEIKDQYGHLLRRYDSDFLDKSKPFDTYEIPLEGDSRKFKGLLDPHGVEFTKRNKRIALIETKIPEQDDLIIFLVKSGIRGLTRVPHLGEECHNLLKNYSSFVIKREETVRGLIENRTADEEMQEKIYNALQPLLLSIV
jgi:type I restriction-modification system DNA methylase subunit